MELPVLKRHFGVVITHLYQVEGEESHVGIKEISLSVQIILQHLELEPDSPDEAKKRNLYCILQ